MGYSLCMMADFANFQNALIFRIWAVFSSRFLHKTTAMCRRNVFSMFLCIFNFWPKVTILHDAWCMMADFANFQNALIFRIWAVFCIKQLQCAVETFLACFYAFLIFDLKWRFCMGYSLCMMADFANFQNALIFRIWALFSSRFLHQTTAMCCRNVFSMFLCIFNFWFKVTILHGL